MKNKRLKRENNKIEAPWLQTYTMQADLVIKQCCSQICSETLKFIYSQTHSWMLGSFEKALFISEFTQGKVGVPIGRVAAECDGQWLVLTMLEISIFSHLIRNKNKLTFIVQKLKIN